MTGDGDLKDPITSRNMLIIDQKRPFAEGAFLMRMSDVVAFFWRPDTECICYSPLDTVAAEGSTYDSSRFSSFVADLCGETLGTGADVLSLHHGTMNGDILYLKMTIAV